MIDCGLVFTFLLTLNFISTMLTNIIGIVLLALFLVPILILNSKKYKKNNQETEENK